MRNRFFVSEVASIEVVSNLESDYLVLSGFLSEACRNVDEFKKKVKEMKSANE